MTDAPAGTPKLPPLARVLVEAGPLIAFFVAEQMADIFVATAVLIPVTAAALAVSWAVERRLAILPVVSLGFVAVFGALTLALDDEVFIQLEVTITNGLCGAFLLGGLAFGKSLLQVVFDDFAPLDDAGWRKATLYMGLFFVFTAVLNEIVRRTVSTELWVEFRVFGILILTIVFMASLVPMLRRHWQD